MARHSFIQESKLRNVTGRIDYISNPARQEHLYASLDTANASFWKELALESRTEFKRSGADGECIEARELIIALPEDYTEYNPAAVLKEFTEAFKNKYDVECVSALHHNKSMTNYHIHLIFSERKFLPEPEVKIASRNLFYDETGRHVRTKKEIFGEDGQIRSGCKVIKKGEVYEQHLFSRKDPRFKSEAFLGEIKHFYTNLINYHIDAPDKQVKVFDPESVYLPTKKIGKNNPKASEIKADNEARKEWNRTADVALVTGVPEETVLDVKRKQIGQKAKESVNEKGWLPGLFRGIVYKAVDRMKDLVRALAVPPRPIPKVDLKEYDSMVKLYKNIAREAGIVNGLNIKIHDLEKELDRTKGLFKGAERKRIQNQIDSIVSDRKRHERSIDSRTRKAGYPNVQTFLKTYKKAEKLVREYLMEEKGWKEKATGSPIVFEKQVKGSLRQELRLLSQEANIKPKVLKKHRSHIL